LLKLCKNKLFADKKLNKTIKIFKKLTNFIGFLIFADIGEIFMSIFPLYIAMDNQYNPSYYR
jgi:hypothetical protein